MATNTPSKSASERAALIQEARTSAWAIRESLDDSRNDIVRGAKEGRIDLLTRLADVLEAADRDAQQLVGSLKKIAQMPCISSLLGEEHDDCGCAACVATQTLEGRAFYIAARAAEETGR